jgi:hypothetical protein
MISGVSGAAPPPLQSVWSLDLAADFETQGQYHERTPTEGGSNTVDETGIDGTAPTLRCVTPEGGGLALDRRFRFADMGAASTDEMFFRFRVHIPGEYLTQDNSSGKMSGLAGSITDAIAWGGSRPEGAWSGRVLFGHEGASGTYLYVESPIGGNYPYGYAQWNGWWTAGWNTVLLHYRLNTPGNADGLLREWRNGGLVLTRNDIEYRPPDQSELLIDRLLLHFGMDTVAPPTPPDSWTIHYADVELLVPA